jgi:hypothetical protein
MASTRTYKFGNWEYTEDELERMLDESDQHGKEAVRRQVRAKTAKYDVKSRRLLITLSNGTTLMLPLHLLKEFAGATIEELAAVELRPRGAALHWVKLDLDFSVAGLMAAAIGANPLRDKRRRRVAS